jgi:acyl carrier protein
MTNQQSPWKAHALEIIASVCEADSTMLTEESRLFDLGVDSVAQLAMITAFEIDVDRAMDDDDILRMTQASLVGEVLAVLERYYR